MEDAECLPWSKEEEKLVSSKLGAFSKPAGSIPMQYDAWSYARYKGMDGKSDMTLKLYGDY
jgi:hypothetical protein